MKTPLLAILLALTSMSCGPNISTKLQITNNADAGRIIYILNDTGFGTPAAKANLKALRSALTGYKEKDPAKRAYFEGELGIIAKDVDRFATTFASEREVIRKLCEMSVEVVAVNNSMLREGEYEVCNRRRTFDKDFLTKSEKRDFRVVNQPLISSRVFNAVLDDLSKGYESNQLIVKSHGNPHKYLLGLLLVDVRKAKPEQLRKELIKRATAKIIRLLGDKPIVEVIRDQAFSDLLDVTKLTAETKALHAFIDPAGWEKIFPAHPLDSLNDLDVFRLLEEKKVRVKDVLDRSQILSLRQFIHDVVLKEIDTGKEFFSDEFLGEHPYLANISMSKVFDENELITQGVWRGELLFKEDLLKDGVLADIDWEAVEKYGVDQTPFLANLYYHMSNVRKVVLESCNSSMRLTRGPWVDERYFKKYYTYPEPVPHARLEGKLQTVYEVLTLGMPLEQAIDKAMALPPVEEETLPEEEASEETPEEEI